MIELTLINGTTRRRIAQRVELALTRRDRRRGLLGRARLEPGTALVLVPCAAVHTAFMRFPIDLVFVNRHGCAIRVVKRLPPWRVAIAPKAHSVIELAAGSLERQVLQVGDRVCLVRSDEQGAQEDIWLDEVREWALAS